MEYKEAFKEQLIAAKALTEADLRVMATTQVCRLSNEPFEAGDKILYLMVPSVDEGVDFELIAAKAAAVEALDARFQRAPDSLIPRLIG